MPEKKTPVSLPREIWIAVDKHGKTIPSWCDQEAPARDVASSLNAQLVHFVRADSSKPPEWPKPVAWYVTYPGGYPLAWTNEFSATADASGKGGQVFPLYLHPSQPAGEWTPKAGAEAEELRREIEKLIARGDAVETETLQRLLDDVDARDALDFVERVVDDIKKKHKKRKLKGRRVILKMKDGLEVACSPIVHTKAEARARVNAWRHIYPGYKYSILCIWEPVK